MTSPQCKTCPLSRYFYARPPTREEPGEPAGWECEAQDGLFISEWRAPNAGNCPYLTGYLAAPPHHLDAALARNSEAGNKAAVVWLAENVPGDLLRQAWQSSAPCQVEERYRAECEFEHSARSGALEN